MMRLEIIGLNYRKAVVRMTDDSNDEAVVFTVTNDERGAYEALHSIVRVAANNLAERSTDKELSQFAKLADLHGE